MLNYSSHHPKALNGFTLLEVMITISLLSVMVLAVSELLKGSVDMRLAVSEKEQVTSRLNTTLQTIKNDLEHTYLLSVNKDKELVQDVKNHTYFQLQTFASKTTLSFTTLHPHSLASQEGSGELAKVTYELKESERYPNRMALWRGSLAASKEADITPILISEGIRGFAVEVWNGQGWITSWDSEKTEFRNSLPRLVRVTLRAYLDPANTDAEDLVSVSNTDELHYTGERRTIIYIPWAKRFPEIKDKIKTLNL